ncbi:hypothetical protein ILUMI_12300 [Ignelater luminosus]|uniref:Uncharacterized protein n=1 Tax=Ignelater luminosus TaxID=2038154 RepID=A0A8K0D0K8_IGNLU|nr:hypothetical protein ILUMI_12300 [Ignelater luminosus]
MKIMKKSDYDSNSEAEAIRSLSEDGDEMRKLNYYLSKDNQTKWKKIPQQNVRTRSCNIITHLPGPIKEKRTATTEIASLNSFLDNTTIVSTIVKYTNISIDSVKDNFSRERYALHTDPIELQTFIDIRYIT